MKSIKVEVRKMSENKRANKDNEGTMTSFDCLIETIKTNYLNNGDYMTPLYNLSIACAYSVCNKLQFVGYTDKIRLLKQSIASGLSMLSGSVTSEKKVSDIVGDGMDLVHAAFATGLDEVEKHNGDLKTPYLISRVSRRVWYTDPDICKPTDTETSGIREMYRAARRYVQDNRAVSTDAANRHQYIEYNMSEFSDDDGMEEFMEDYVIYRRMSTVYSGADDIALTDAIASDRGDADTIDTMIDSLGLSEKEEKILRYRLRGYGEKATGKALGVSRDAVHGTLNRIRSKARKSDMFKQYLNNV
jgi:DNA-binding CsgD family transcriptional regulator